MDRRRTKKEEQVTEINSYIIVTVEATCAACDKEDTLAGVCDEEDGCNELYERGWRVINDNLYCRRCASKLRKK